MYSLLNYLVILLFIIFICAYLGKLILLRRKNKINANVLARGQKDWRIKIVEVLVKISAFLWGTLWFLLPIAELLGGKYYGSFNLGSIARFSGIIFLTAGLVVFIVAAISMKASWRVGIDKDTTTALIKDGIYTISRNPAFVGFDLMFVGLFLAYPMMPTLAVLISCIASIHLLIKQEEKHLTSAFGNEYIEYKLNTPRYLIF